MNKRKLLLLSDNDYIGIAGVSSPVVATHAIFRINNSANRRNGGMTLFSPNQFFHDTVIGDIDDSFIDSVLSDRLNDEQYYGQG